ncbi:GntR family transcriptional regulator [Pokkaliibacter plantistimulans]|uniref:GntR family transcriptional regulator n=1 Tax=Pokkaliibacter plantistimulans TaxID=1635171 RepID=A0ABX5LSE8_9GAMM|nr:GntR family transcriptional regulator [Pokkaliibacter plantistimulans]PXF29572.1 GntR family transcriptional regulator [Pokkaliibacter plantistimulans]
MITTPEPAFARVARQLREELIKGNYQPGQTLTEADLTVTLQASRNTVREALRVLYAEGLVSYEPNKGVRVRILDQRDLADIFVTRRTLELQAVSLERPFSTTLLRQMEAVVHAEQQAAALDDWHSVGTHSLHLHQLLVSNLGSQRMDAFFAILVAQLRLLFASAPDEHRFQQPWVDRDSQLCQLLREQRRDEAYHLLQQYLDDSEANLVRLLSR